MRPIVLHETAAEIAFFVSLALWQAIEFTMAMRTNARGHTTREWTQPLIGLGLVGGTVFAIVLAAHESAPLPGPGWLPATVGLTLLWVGIALRLWAVRTLGDFFKVSVVIQDDHRVVDTGPYRWVRHPSYSGALLTALGIGIALADWTSIAIMIVFPLSAFLIRIRVEERLLSTELGDAYRSYARRTARLVPRVF
ncbi:MAG TPA: isoprenylcysteine carboxylmethyltransferase family protein [Solirubrobacteraceae bacterium]|jgi:protein-S-isoprenylcysteine O-methyltransferase Ste14|nr:isoprenylcysteine carboxylmethyltransferase family protein [Solirubrobacteraceae bacterium]